MANAYPHDWQRHEELMCRMKSKWKAFKKYQDDGGELSYAEWSNGYNL